MSEHSFIPNSFQIPNAYVDMLMPALTRSEFVILVYLCRRIFGWQKRSEKIGGRAIAKATNISLATCQKSLVSLSELGIIIITPSSNPRDPHQYSLQLEFENVNWDMVTNRLNGIEDPLPPAPKPDVIGVDDTMEVSRLSKSEMDDMLAKLIVYFSNITGIPYIKPNTKSQITQTATLWWSPLKQIMKLTNYDGRGSCNLMFEAVDRLRKGGLTISSPKSILNTVIGLYGEHKQDGAFDGVIQVDQGGGITGI